MYGLVLEGGGAKGAYHVGAYDALMDLGIKVDGVAGTSIGALNGALIVQGDYNKLKKIWGEITLESLFGIDKNEILGYGNKKLTDINFAYLFDVSKDIISNKGLDTTKMRKLIENLIDEEKIRKSKLDFGIVTVSLTDKQPLELLKEEIPKGKLVDYTLASANLPGFKMKKMDGKYFLDGGVYDNLPFGVLQRKGYENFIAVRTYGLGRVRKVSDPNINIVYIQPVEELGGTIDFDIVRAKHNIKLGYFDTMKVFKQLRGHKYYLNPYKKDFLQCLIDVVKNKEEKIKNIGYMFGFENMTIDRLVFEGIFPRLENILDMKDKYDYQDVVIRLFEYIAEKYKDIEQFKIYDMEDFFKIVLNKYISKPLKINKKIPSFIKQNKLLAITVKDDLLVNIFKELFI